jgi:hypothetical protein
VLAQAHKSTLLILYTNRQFLLFSPAVPCLHRHIRGLFSTCTQTDNFHCLVLQCRFCTGISGISLYPLHKQTVFHSLVLRCRAYTGTSGGPSRLKHIIQFSQFLHCRAYTGYTRVALLILYTYRQSSQFSPAVPCLHRNIRGLFSSCTHKQTVFTV